MSLKLAVAVLLMLRVSDVLGSTDCDLDEVDLCDDDGAMGGGGSTPDCDSDETDLCDDDAVGGGGSVGHCGDDEMDLCNDEASSGGTATGCDGDEGDLCDESGGGSGGSQATETTTNQPTGDSEECMAATASLKEACPAITEVNDDGGNMDEALIARVCMAECVEKMDSVSMACKDSMSSDMKEMKEMIVGVSFTCTACGMTWMGIARDCGMNSEVDTDMTALCAPTCQDGLSRVETEGCSDKKLPGGDRRLAILEPANKLMKSIGANKRRLEGHSQDDEPQTIGAAVKALKDMCDPEGCAFAMTAMGPACQQGDAEPSVALMCSEGPCKTSIDAVQAKCKDDPMGAEVVASLDSSLSMMCGAVGGCMAAMQEMAPKCGLEDDAEPDMEKVCAAECQAVLQSFTTEKCFEGLGGRRLSRKETAIAKRDLARLQKLGQERRLTSHDSVAVTGSGDDGGAGLMMMMMAVKPAVEMLQSMCGVGEKTCMTSMMSLSMSCPAMGGNNGDEDGSSEEMMKQVCDDGACKTNIDEAMTLCLADPDDASSAEMVKGVATMQIMCSPCAMQMTNMAATCGLNTEHSDVTTMCGFACTAVIEAWGNNNCDAWYAEMGPMMSGEDRRLATKVAEVATKVMPKFSKKMALAPATHNRLRRLEGHEDLHDHEDEDEDMGVAESIAAIAGMCSPCGKQIGALMAHDIHCIDDPEQGLISEANAANSTCIALFCSMRDACPENPAEPVLPFMPLEEYNAVRNNAAITGITTCVATVAPTPAPVAVVSVVFAGDFAAVIGTNVTKKTTFLAECTQSMSNGVSCIDVRAGSLIVDVSGPAAAVDYVVTEIQTKKTLQLPSFEKMQYESSAPLVTTTTAPVEQELDADGATRVFGAVASTGLFVAALMNLFI